MRQWLYETLVQSSSLAAVLGVELSKLPERVVQGESLDTRLITKPYLVYTLGNNTDERLSDEDTASRQFFTIFVHDEPWDYLRVDSIMTVIKTLLIQRQVKLYGILSVIHLEDSRDLDDSTLGTILRYMRFQAIKES